MMVMVVLIYVLHVLLVVQIVPEKIYVLKVNVILIMAEFKKLILVNVVINVIVLQIFLLEILTDVKLVV